MSDEPTQGSGEMSVADAIRLKHSLGQSITWGKSNLNALEVEELTKLSANDYARIRAEYAKWHAQMLIFKSGVVLAILVGCFASYYFTPFGWARVVAFIIGWWCVYALSKREGEAEGYVMGYEAGYESGIYKTLGVSEEELKEMSDMATQMKIDGMLVKSFDKKAGQRE